MACSLSIQKVSFLTGVTPQRIRVYGRAPGCLVVQLTTQPMVTMPVTATTDAFGRFLLETTLLQTFNCGDPNPPTVTVSCIRKVNPTDACMDAQWSSATVLCCDGIITTVNAVVPQGSLLPSAIDVQGICYGCASNLVRVSAVKVLPGGGSVLITTPTPVSVDPTTGVFNSTISLIGSVIGSVTCDDPIEVSAICTSGTCAIQSYRKELICPQCFRAALLVNVAPCSQPNDPTTQVTITAEIGLPTGNPTTFSLDYGNGGPAYTFTIVPVPSPAGSGFVHTHVCPAATYNTGQQYTAILRIRGREMCPLVDTTFRVNCEGCPDATASVMVGNCIVPGPGIDPKLVGTRPVTFTVSVPPTAPANLTTQVSISYGGPDQGTANPTAMPPYQGNIRTPRPLPQRNGPGMITETIYLRPGSYHPTATLYFSTPSNPFCLPGVELELTTRPAGQPIGVEVLTCLTCPPGGVRVSKMQNPPTAPHWRFQADVDWGSNPPPSPPSPVLYQWTVTAPNATDKATAETRPSGGGRPGGNTISTEDGNGWTGALATRNGGVQLTQGGRYTLAVSARYAHNSGLPLDPHTMEVSCNITGGEAFDIMGPPPPNCQTLGGINLGTPMGLSGCADSMQGIVATLDFTVTGTNLASGPYHWNFGDGFANPSTNPNTATTSNLTTRHVYTVPGNYPVEVKVLAAGDCPPSEAKTVVSVVQCPCPPGQVRMANGSCGTPPPGGEGLGCLILRWIAVAFVALGIVGSLILLCMWAVLTPLQQGILLGLSIGLFVAGIILFVIWLIVCRVKPCLWGWLLAGQTCLTVALVCSYMTFCCLTIFLGSAIIFGVFAIIFLGIWIYRCAPTACQVLIELTPVVSDVIAMIATVAIVPLLRNCLNPWVGLAVGYLSAVLVFILASRCTGTSSRTGAPVR